MIYDIRSHYFKRLLVSAAKSSSAVCKSLQAQRADADAIEGNATSASKQVGYNSV